MDPADHIGKLCNAGLDEGFLKVTARVRRRFPIVRNKTTFGCHNDLIAVETSGTEFLKRRSDGALAALQAVIDGAVDDIAAGLDGADNGLVVLLVGVGVVISQIGADADGGEP